jgi:hypothetical protein
MFKIRVGSLYLYYETTNGPLCSDRAFRTRRTERGRVQVIPIQKVNEAAYDRLLKSDVKYRFSIDMASLKSESPASRVG